MKKLICWLLVLTMCFGLAACGTPAPAETTAPPVTTPTTTAPAPTDPPVQPDTDLADAIAYLKNLYKEAAETTASDFQRVGAIRIGTAAYEVVWTADAESVKFTKGEDGMITVDVAEDSETDVAYVLTATLTGTDGTTQSLSWNHVIPASLANNPGKILELAYALEDGQALDTVVTLTGVISNVDTPWSEDYQNITVTMKVPGFEDYPIQCYRLAGEGAKELAYGDTITVTGTIKNYKGTIEFDAGCALDAVTKGTGEDPETPTDYDIIVAEAMALKPGQSLPYTATLTGRVESIDYAYSEKYGDISITIEVRGEDIYCYRLSSPKTEWLKQVGEKDWVTVMGKIKNYNGTIEFDSATMIAYTDFYRVEGPEDPLEHIDAAYELKENKELEYESTLTGVVTAVNTPWSDDYKNITVTIQVPGREDKPIRCYRLTGEGAKDLGTGDTITVKGYLMNDYYKEKSTIQFKAGCEVLAVEKAPEDVFTPLTSAKDIVNAAYDLEENTTLHDGYKYTLTGIVVDIGTEYSEQYKNITVTMVVGDMDSKPIVCYRLKGDEASKIAVGDNITVTGVLKNYNGTVEFDSGCVLDEHMTQVEIVEAAYALAEGEKLDKDYTLFGVITSVDTAYSDEYKNVTVTVATMAEGKSIVCFRMKGTGADAIKVGDTIIVNGQLTNYKGTYEFNSGCKLLAYSSASAPEEPAPEETVPEETTPETVVPEGSAPEVAPEESTPETAPEETVPADPAADSALSITDAAALGVSKEHDTYTEGKYYVVGEIVEIKSTKYGNMIIKDAEGNTLYIYGTYSADGSARYDAMETKPVAGDTVKIYGIIGQYNGSAQMKNGWIVEHTPGEG